MLVRPTTAVWLVTFVIFSAPVIGQEEAAQEAKIPKQPIDLFNGEDLAGWSFDSLDTEDISAIYTVEDGLLKVSGNPRGVLRTQANYRDYEIELQWRWPARPGNSGLLVHCSKPRERNIWPKSLEVQLQSGAAGDFWMIGEYIDVENREDRLRRGRNLPNMTDDSENPVGEWNTMVCQLRGDTIRVTVNGELVNVGWGLSTSSGAICLQSEGAAIEFRKLQIRPLPEQEPE
ncbi:MAG: DUF1080 domain-containing protein [Planctomycetota bacterium]